jgi:hypothetical protein
LRLHLKNLAAWLFWSLFIAAIAFMAGRVDQSGASNPRSMNHRPVTADVAGGTAGRQDCTGANLQNGSQNHEKSSK